MIETPAPHRTLRGIKTTRPGRPGLRREPRHLAADLAESHPKCLGPPEGADRRREPRRRPDKQVLPIVFEKVRIELDDPRN